MATTQQLWLEMLDQSFHPAQWWSERDWPEDEPSGNGVKAMWVMSRIVGGWEVGYFDPKGDWHHDGEVYGTRELAARAVHYLNGGS